MSVTLFRQTRPYMPSFANGTTGGPSGTVTDGGRAGRVTFTLPSSGHTDARDGCYIAWPARDVLGRTLPTLPAGLTSAADREVDTAGPLRWRGVSAPTFGNGVHIMMAFAMVQDLSDIWATTTWLYGAAWEYFEFGGDPFVQVIPIRYNGGTYSTVSQQGTTDVQRGSVATPGAWEAGAPIGHTLEASGDTNRARSNTWEDLTSAVAGAHRVVVAGAYRTGASAGSETLTVDVEAALTQMEALA